IAIGTLISLVRETGARLHLCRLSTQGAVELVRAAKADGLPVTCDVSAHHLHLSEMDIGYFDSNCRLEPPLRSQRDREALSRALGVESGRIEAGAPADLILLDPQEPVHLTAERLKSQGKNTPFIGYELLGRVRTTLVAGNVVYEA